MEAVMSQPASRHTWVGALLLLVLSQGVFGYELSARRNYTVFQGHISVEYSYPSEVLLPLGRVQLVDLNTNNSVVASAGLPPGYPEGVLTFMCGAVEHAGEFVFQMVEKPGGKVLKETAIMYVKWPSFQMKLPPTHVAQEDTVTLQFTPLDVLCDVVNPQGKFTIDVVYYGKNDSSSLSIEELIKNRPKQLIHRQEIEGFNQKRTININFDCNLFDVAGIYKVLFTSLEDLSKPIASSNTMIVRWSDSYTLEYRMPSIFPCRSYVTINYNYPQCIGNEDKIRLYKMIHIAQSSAASPTNLVYMEEKRVTQGRYTSSFECNRFHEDFIGYCFKYISMSHKGAVSEQKTRCIPTQNQPDIAVNGGWGSWAAWSACSVSCGYGSQTRYRACDSPTPTWGGLYCPGDTTQSQECTPSCKATTPAAMGPFTPEKDCECGCTLTSTQGKIVATDRCPGTAVWVITADPGKVIKLTFTVFTLDDRNRLTWVKVRNGATQMSDLLLHVTGGPMPDTARTTKNAMLIEFMSPVDKDSEYTSSEGFIAFYSEIEGNGTLAYIPDEKEERPWVTTVTLVGIGLCLVIIMVTVACVVHHRHIQKQDKAKQAQVNQALLVNGEIPNSPSHSGHSIQGSANISFSDPASVSPTRRQYVLPAKGVSANLHSPDGSGPSFRSKHKHRNPGREHAQQVDSPDHHSRQSSITSSHRHGSAGTPSSAYASPQDMPSPYAANAKTGDYLHDPKTLKTKGDLSPTKSRYHKHKHPDRHKRSSKSPDGAHRVSSPVSPSRHSGSVSARSHSPSTPRSDSRNQSFKQAIANRSSGGVPLADMEDLSPTSPTTSPPISPTRRHHHDRDKRRSRSRDKMGDISENIPMEYYDKKERKHKKMRGESVADTTLYSPRRSEPRPPVEGRDSLKRKKEPSKSSDKLRPKSSGTPTSLPTTPDRQNANYLPSEGKPHLKPLPLRNIQRPDGQSPENKPEDPNANTPSSTSLDLSPVLTNTKLFPDTSRTNTPSDIFIHEQEDFEYDDYMPSLPGSYFTMDPSAYTLTWSQQPPWMQKKSQPASSHSSINNGNGHHESNA